jgi:hypothetical protein
MGKLVIALISIPVLSFFLGMLFGEANSPDYATEDAGRRHVAAYARFIKADELDVVLQVHGGTRIYQYSSKSNAVTQQPLIAALSGQRNPRRWATLEYKRVDAILGVGTFGANLATMTGLMAREHQWLPAEKYIVAGAVIAGAAGGIFGYWLTYSDTADYDNANFKKGLNDKDVWKLLSGAVRACGISRTPDGTVTMNHKQSGLSADQKSLCESIVGRSHGTSEASIIDERELKQQPAK